MGKENVTVVKPGKYYDWDRALSELSSEYRLQIFRKEPNFCDGLIYEIDIDPEEPISADEIRRRFGGRRLTAKILAPDGSYIKQRTFNFPDPPKEHGIELVPGPYGTAIRKDEYEKQQQTQQQAQGQSLQPNTDLQTNLLQSLIQAQSQQNQNMQNMLVQRVNHLEGLLENRAETTAEPQYISQNDSKPFDGLKDTIKMIKEMEELKAIMGTARGDVSGESPSPWTGAIEKMLDFVLERERVNMQTKQAQALAAQNVPPLPPASSVSSQPQSDLQLIDTLRSKLSSSDNATKAQLMQAILGDDLESVIELIPEHEEEFNNVVNESCPEDEEELNSMISAEDRAKLGELDGETDRTPAQSLSETS